MNKLPGLFLLFLSSVILTQKIFAQESEIINNIQSLQITETDNDTFITLTATDKINYTIFKMDDPPRITLDFGNADLKDLKRSYSIDNGIIKNIKIITEVEGGLPISRIEINMEKLMDFSVTQEDNKLLISVSKITAYKPPETQPEPAQEEQGLEGELSAEAGLPEGMGEIPVPEAGTPEVFGVPGEAPPAGVVPAPEEEGVIAFGAPLPEEEEKTTPEEGVTEEVETTEEGEISLEEEPTIAETEFPEGEEIPEVTTEESGAIAVAEVPSEGEIEVPQGGESIEGVIEKSETTPAVIAPEVVPVSQEEKKSAVVAQAPPPIEITPPPPPLPEKVEKKAWIKGNKIVTSEKIKFNSNEAILPVEYESTVQEIAKILTQNQKIKIRIEGYTDNVGDDEFNRALSEYRAIWIKLLLERFGVPSNRIQVAGMGKSNPIASNKTEKGREKNRRVEFIIIQK